ncbi:NAD(P)-dependent oxidoreductase [Roseococcus sp. SDR]|uniref:NAD(P)-dependent oxidoreductase n=1 Tax=Roseococcus sp. SDR TaxID=2835532 RepID=UPI001BCC7C0C|nr:NAD(P)-dependent oxidoreductase [Roseococcus sp. SDR]MBS7792795.1 NAD(P)-dependent oxidoreductase [Roseococcus sp. SDR]MBV1848109.1 NAD(P)-dependent oxidoreductase [Roseococcus sp. SDR]
MENVGFIGLGMMGRPMAMNLAAKQVPLTTLDAAGVTLEGVPAAADAAALAGACRLIILMVPDSKAVASVMGALLPALQKGSLVIDMGSSEPGETRRWAAALAEKGCAMLDAPVSGSVPKARAGTLAIMVGGADADFTRAEPVLRAMGEAIIRTGAIGSAHAMKALNNYVYAAGLLAVSEAAQMAEAQGLDLGIFAAVLNASSGRNIASETKLAQEITSRRYAGGFQLGLMRKDLETAGGIAAATGAEAPLLALLRARWTEALGVLGPRADNTEIHRYITGTTKP